MSGQEEILTLKMNGNKKTRKVLKMNDNAKKSRKINSKNEWQ